MAPALPYNTHAGIAPIFAYNVTMNAAYNGTQLSDEPWRPNGSDWINVAIGVVGLSVAVTAVVLDHKVHGFFDRKVISGGHIEYH